MIRRNAFFTAALVWGATLFSTLGWADTLPSQHAPEPPGSYPASMMLARSTFTVSPATPVTLGKTLVVLEESRLSDVAAIAGAPLYKEGENENARRWICVQGNNDNAPLRLWFIASGQDTVTEVQMRPGVFAPQSGCGTLSKHFSPVRLSRIASGMTLSSVVNDIGPTSYRDNAGWSFWVSRRTYVYDEQNFTEYVWVGARVENERIVDVFTTQLTR